MADMFNEVWGWILDRINSVDWDRVICNLGEPILRWYSRENIVLAIVVAIAMAGLWILLLWMVRGFGSLLESCRFRWIHRIGLWFGEKHERLYWWLPLMADPDHKEKLAEAARARQERLVQATKVRR